MLRTIACLCLVLAALPAAAAPSSVAPQKNWRQLTTANFHVVGSASEGDLRRAASRLEQFRQAVGILLPKVVLVSSAPTTVIVFRDEKDLRSFTPLYKGKPRTLGGYFLPTATANYVTLTASHLEEFGVIYHEYVHLLVNNTEPGLPAWYSEGLAEFYATFKVTGGGREAVIGSLQTDHVLRLREQWLPLATLVTIGRDSPEYNEENKASIFYAESWALVHYLVLGREGRYARAVPAFLSALAGGDGFDAACTKAFNMGGAALERELRQYIDLGRYTMTMAKFDERIGSVEKVPVGPVSEARVHAMLGDLLYRLQRPDDARAEVDAALALDATLPEAHSVMGRMLFASGRKDAAMEHLEQAAAAPDAPWGAQFEYAAVLIDGRTAGAISPALDAATERALRRTIELQPSFPDAYALLAFMRAQTEAGLPEAATLLEQALKLAPRNERYWLMLAHVSDARSDAVNARAIAARLAAGASDAEIRAEAAALQARLDAAALRDSTAPVKRAVEGPDPQADAAFRKPGADERRLAGRLTAIDCSTGGPVFVVTSTGSEARIGAASFRAVELISYRADVKGQLACGPQPGVVVILTYRPGGGGRAPTAVALEFLPDGWVPK